MKKILIVAAVLILGVAGGVAYLLTQEDPVEQVSNTMQNPKTSTTTTTQVPSTPVATSTKPGTYAEYTESSIASTSDTKLIFFHAAWCPQCRALEADIKADGVPSGVAIFKVDYDTSQALRQKYGVTLQTTVVRVDDNGNLVKKFVAYSDPSLDSVKENLL